MSKFTMDNINNIKICIKSYFINQINKEINTGYITPGEAYNIYLDNIEEAQRLLTLVGSLTEEK